MPRALGLSLLLAAAPAAAVAQAPAPLRIEHTPPGCLTPGRHAVLSFHIEPVANVVRARLLFRAEAGAEPHELDLATQGAAWTAVLPRATAALASLRYRAVAEDPALQVTESEEYVVAVATRCASPAPTRKKAAMLVQAPLGAPPVPAGFLEPDPPEAPGSGRAGIFTIGPLVSLGAALALGGAAVAAAANATGGEDAAQHPVEISLVEASPPLGSTVRVNTFVRVEVRVVPADHTIAAPELDLLTSPGGPACVTLRLLPVEFQGGFGRSLSFSGFLPAGTCAEGTRVTAVRVRLVAEDGRVVLSTGTPEFPDLPFDYTLVR